jgi:hypothetical protein
MPTDSHVVCAKRFPGATTEILRTYAAEPG